MFKRHSWKSVKDIEHIITKVNSYLEVMDYDNAAYELIPITFHYLLVWGEYNLVIELWQQCIKKLTIPYLEMEAHNNIGLAYKYRGEPDAALPFLKKGLEIAEKNGQTEWIGIFNCNMGIVYSEMGDYGRAIERYHMLLQCSQKVNNKMNEGIALGNIGNAYYWLEKYEQSIDYCHQHIKIAAEVGDKVGQGNSLGTMGACYCRLGKFKKAIDCQEKYLVLSEEINFLEGKARAYEGLGEGYLGLKQYEAAEKYYLASYEEWKKTENLYETGEVLKEIIALYKKTGNKTKACIYEQELNAVKKKKP